MRTSPLFMTLLPSACTLHDPRDTLLNRELDPMVLQLARRSEYLLGTGEIRRMHLDAVHDGTFDEVIDTRRAQQALDDHPCVVISTPDKSRSH